MRFYFLIILLTVLFISSFGCSHDSGNPATPDVEREIQDFDFGSNEIFGPNTNGAFAANFHDIDLCQDVARECISRGSSIKFRAFNYNPFAFTPISLIYSRNSIGIHPGKG